MKTAFTYLLALIALMLPLQAASQPSTSVEQAVGEMMLRFPMSQLRDVYKSFFQDRFGLEHLVPDSASAARYLDRELEQMDDDNRFPDFEPTGNRHNFVRVNLHLVKQGLVPRHVLLHAVLESAAFNAELVEQWRDEWTAIEKTIGRIYPALLQGSDRAEIQTLLASGRYALHHSERFRQCYDPHYRIVAREVFLREIYPLIRCCRQ